MMDFFDKEDFGLLESIASEARILTDKQEIVLDKYRTLGLGYVHYIHLKDTQTFTFGRN